jgi:hypothetical protein
MSSTCSFAFPNVVFSLIVNLLSYLGVTGFTDAVADNRAFSPEVDLLGFDVLAAPGADGFQIHGSPPWK